MCAGPPSATLQHMPRYVLHHQHRPSECGVAFASFKGHETPLRHRITLGSCAYGDHTIWWTVEAGSEHEALALLPHFVAQRATATKVADIEVP
jgi:hypothetical protein